LLGDTKLSTSLEIEQLQNEKTSLEEESHNLDEELKQLEMRSKILAEKIAIQELKNENATKQQTVSQLASKIGMLETRLEKLVSGDIYNEDTTNANAQEPATETNFPEENGQNEDTIRVMALDNEETVIENVEAEQRKESQEVFY
jgi:hypothetical protein